MFANFTEETCTGTGTTLSLTGVTTDRIAFSKSFADGDLVAYVLEDSGGTIIVAGVGTYVSATNDITRADTWNWNGTIIDENPATNITLSTGTHTVRCSPIENQLIGLTPSNPEILGGDADGTLFISPSAANALGGNIVLYGDLHATKAKDIELRSNAGVELAYDDSASKWNFQTNAIDTSGIFTSTNTTDSTSTTTGSIQTDGGLGVAKTIVAGTGISLGGSATANLLDDYEEGAFTPEVADAVSGGNIASTSTAAGSYTKVGNLVKCTIRLDNIDTTGLTVGNLLYVRGLPFTAKSGTTRHYGTVTVANSVTFSGYLSMRIGPGGAEGLLFDNTSGTSAGILLISALSSGVSDLELEISYLT